MRPRTVLARGTRASTGGEARQAGGDGSVGSKGGNRAGVGEAGFGAVAGSFGLRGASGSGTLRADGMGAAPSQRPVTVGIVFEALRRATAPNVFLVSVNASAPGGAHVVGDAQVSS